MSLLLTNEFTINPSQTSNMVGPSLTNTDASPKPSALISPSITQKEISTGALKQAVQQRPEEVSKMNLNPVLASPLPPRHNSLMARPATTSIRTTRRVGPYDSPTMSVQVPVPKSRVSSTLKSTHTTSQLKTDLSSTKVLTTGPPQTSNMVGLSLTNKDASPKPSALLSPSITQRESPTDEHVPILITIRKKEEVYRPVAPSIELSTENSASKSEEGWGPSTEHLTVVDSSTLNHGQFIALEEAMKVLAEGDKEAAQHMLRIAGIALYEDGKDNKSEDGDGSPEL